MEKAVFFWSGGKDSALALFHLRQQGDYEVVSLLTTCNEHFQRVSMHGVRLELLEQQAAALGLPLEKMFVSQRSSNEEYTQKLLAHLLSLRERGVTAVVFGDIFLEDLRQWREQQMRQAGLKAVFPLWKKDTRGLIEQFVAAGFGSVLCCVNDAYLGPDFLGRNIDEGFLASLPPGVDPCGENGEFHSFAFAGPIFRQPLKVTVGERIYRPVEQTHPGSVPADGAGNGTPLTKGFWFCDLLSS